MLSQTVEYALRAVVHLANVAPEAATTDQIAQVTRVPKAYLSKVLQSLVRGGIVRSQRGLGGGMTLTRPPSQLTLLDVVNAVEPIQRIRTCPLGLSTHGARLCPLHRRLDQALAQVESAFAQTVLAELLAEPSPSVPLCEVPAAVRQPIVGRRGRRAATRVRSG
ncbi:MAG: transcriptional regulator [Isosphaeraceae bacterium]|jgi:Rrf2 family protein|nr:MAG: transcriptional regulator [Isosphaeraceae bacterium]